MVNHGADGAPGWYCIRYRKYHWFRVKFYITTYPFIVLTVHSVFVRESTSSATTMVSIEDYVAASSGWGSSMLTFMQDAPSAGIDDWLLASPSACCTVVMLYLIAVMVSRGRGIVIVVVGRLYSFPPTT